MNVLKILILTIGVCVAISLLPWTNIEILKAVIYSALWGIGAWALVQWVQERQAYYKRADRKKDESQISPPR